MSYGHPCSRDARHLLSVLTSGQANVKLGNDLCQDKSDNHLGHLAIFSARQYPRRHATGHVLGGGHVIRHYQRRGSRSVITNVATRNLYKLLHVGPLRILNGGVWTI